MSSAYPKPAQNSRIHYVAYNVAAFLFTSTCSFKVHLMLAICAVPACLLTTSSCKSANVAYIGSSALICQ